MALHPPRRHLTSLLGSANALQVLAPPERQHDLPHLYLIAVFKQLVAHNTLPIDVGAVRAVLIMEQVASLLITVDQDVQT
jgi:hypothetical protein